MLLIRESSIEDVNGYLHPFKLKFIKVKIFLLSFIKIETYEVKWFNVYLVFKKVYIYIYMVLCINFG